MPTLRLNRTFLGIGIQVYVALLTIKCNAQQPGCVDEHRDCGNWRLYCKSSTYVEQNCVRTCGRCTGAGNGGSAGRSNTLKTTDYDVSLLPRSLQPVSFLVGRWRADHSGKARFPTIPVFTYGEEVSFSIAKDPRQGAQSLNYTAFAFGMNEAKELHSEYGFMAVDEATGRVALTTTQGNGFSTVEEGAVSGARLTLRLQDIGRISFSHDLPVHDMRRVFRLIDADTLEQRLDMETLTHGMQEHTFVTYRRLL